MLGTEAVQKEIERLEKMKASLWVQHLIDWENRRGLVTANIAVKLPRGHGTIKRHSASPSFRKSMLFPRLGVRPAGVGGRSHNWISRVLSHQAGGDGLGGKLHHPLFEV